MSTVFTLFEKSYHHGVAALANSLIRNRFSGRLVVGYRGEVPSWAGNWRKNDFGDREDTITGCRIILSEIKENGHLTYKKTWFLNRLIERYASEAYFYFDPDVNILCDWSVFEKWVTGGIACCADIKPIMPTRHPLRQMWRSEFSDQFKDLSTEQNCPPYYMNAGFFGIHADHIGFMNEVEVVLEKVLSKVGGTLDHVALRHSGREAAFFIPDQDAFNIALMLTKNPIAWVGPDGMNFESGGGGFLMAHAVHQVKPWNKRLILSSLAGKRITPADIAFWKYCDQPLPAFSPLKVKIGRLRLKLASAYGRLRGDVLMQ